MMRRRLPIGSIMLSIMLAWGCGSRPGSAEDSQPPDGGPVADGPQPSSWRFVPEDDGSASPAVVLRQSDGTTGSGVSDVWIDVVVRGVASLQGVAFRLAFDPQQVKVAASEEGQVWQQSSVKHVARFAVRTEGELWAGLGHVGSGGLAAPGSGVTVARVRLTPVGSGTIPIMFRKHHNIVLDAKGTAVKVEWLGGQLEPSSK